MRIERLVSTYSLEVEWVHFPLHPETPPEGMSLAELFAGRDFDIEQAKARLRQVAESQGLPLGDRTHTYNSRLAQELAVWADTRVSGSEASGSRKPGPDIHDLLFRAYFVEGLNLHQLDVLVDIASSAGLPADEARTVIEERTFRDTVDQHWQLSRNAGVTGVPTFAAEGLAVVGAQPYEMLQRLVVTAGAQKRR